MLQRDKSKTRAPKDKFAAALYQKLNVTRSAKYLESFILFSQIAQNV